MSTASLTPPLPSPVGVEAALCAANGLELERLPAYGWLVRRVRPDRSRPVIGCIDEFEHSVELMEMDGGFRWSTFASLHEALTHLLAATPRPGEERIFDPEIDRQRMGGDLR